MKMDTLLYMSTSCSIPVLLVKLATGKHIIV